MTWIEKLSQPICDREAQAQQYGPISSDYIDNVQLSNVQSSQDVELFSPFTTCFNLLNSTSPAVSKQQRSKTLSMFEIL